MSIFRGQVLKGNSVQMGHLIYTYKEWKFGWTGTGKAVHQGKEIWKYSEKPLTSQKEPSKTLMSSTWISRIQNKMKIVTWKFKLLSLW